MQYNVILKSLNQENRAKGGACAGWLSRPLKPSTDRHTPGGSTHVNAMLEAASGTLRGLSAFSARWADHLRLFH